MPVCNFCSFYCLDYLRSDCPRCGTYYNTSTIKPRLRTFELAVFSNGTVRGCFDGSLLFYAKSLDTAIAECRLHADYLANVNATNRHDQFTVVKRDHSGNGKWETLLTPFNAGI